MEKEKVNAEKCAQLGPPQSLALLRQPASATLSHYSVLQNKHFPKAIHYQSLQAGKIEDYVEASREKALGPQHPNVATVLENYAGLLRKINRVTEAKAMEARAREIRAKQTGKA